METPASAPLAEPQLEPASAAPEAAEPAAAVTSAAPVVAEQPSSTDDVSGLAIFARFAKTIALLSFVLPWVTISCAGQPLVSINGLSLINGTVRMRDPMSGVVRTHNGSPELLILLAVIAIIAALIVSFVLPRRRAALVALCSCAAALLLIFVEVFVKIPAEVRQNALRSDGSNRFDSSVATMINVNGAVGFWLCALALVAAIALQWRIRSRVPPDSS